MSLIDVVQTALAGLQLLGIGYTIKGIKDALDHRPELQLTNDKQFNHVVETLRSVKGQTLGFESAFSELSSQLIISKERNKLLLKVINCNQTFTEEQATLLNTIDQQRFGTLEEFRAEPEAWTRRALTGCSLTSEQKLSVINSSIDEEAHEALSRWQSTAKRS